ncbi:MAG: PKD domain-containing protein, partial [Gammaproteobacteria bacterium]
SAKYNQLELDTFDYSSQAGWTRAAQEENFRIMNEMVRDSYLQMAARGDDADKWFADFAIELAEQRYGGSAMASATYVEDYVPAGWQQTPSRPEGVEQLYKRVIEPHCVGCHALQGNNAGEVHSGQALAAAVNFASWEKFNSYREIVADYVFRRGIMPLSLRNWEDFWRDPEDKPALLASFLADPALFDDAGHVIRPGSPVARPGADRRSRSPVQLDGSASSFAQTYAWSIVSPAVTTAELLNANTARPQLANAPDGVYVLSLVVGNARGSSDPEQVVVTIDSSMPAASTLTFVDDIAPILGSASGTECASCHNDSGAYPGIPVRWDDGNPNLYRDVLMRVNRAAPELSLLLVKPSGERHGGGEYLDLSTLADYARYNTILEWIRAGAPCGVTTGSITCD